MIVKQVKILFILTFCLVLKSCSKQSENTVYVYFKDGKSINCVKPKTNKKTDTSIIDYQGTMHKLDDKTFFFCQERFVKTDNDSQAISSKEVEEINFVNHSFLYQEYIKRDMFSKKDTFKEIYIIEMTGADIYIKHKVYWADNPY